MIKDEILIKNFNAKGIFYLQDLKRKDFTEGFVSYLIKEDFIEFLPKRLKFSKKFYYEITNGYDIKKIRFLRPFVLPESLQKIIVDKILSFKKQTYYFKLLFSLRLSDKMIVYSIKKVGKSILFRKELINYFIFKKRNLKYETQKELEKIKYIKNIPCIFCKEIEDKIINRIGEKIIFFQCLSKESLINLNYKELIKYFKKDLYKFGEIYCEYSFNRLLTEGCDKETDTNIFIFNRNINVLKKIPLDKFSEKNQLSLLCFFKVYLGIDFLNIPNKELKSYKKFLFLNTL